MGAAASSPFRRAPERGPRPRRGLRAALIAAALALALPGCLRIPPPGRTALLEEIASQLSPPSAAAPDYAAAAALLDAYLARHPDEAGRPELAALRPLLQRAAAEAARPSGQERVGQLQEEVRELRGAVERLGRENEELRAVVEQLKELDMDMEERRRQVR